MSKKADLIKRSAASLAALDEFRSEAPRVYPIEDAAAPAQTRSTPPPLPPAETPVQRSSPAEVPATPPRERRRPGRPRSEMGPMVPFASRVKVSKKQELADLAYRTKKTETALLDEALELLFRRYQQ